MEKTDADKGVEKCQIPKWYGVIERRYPDRNADSRGNTTKAHKSLKLAYKTLNPQTEDKKSE